MKLRPPRAALALLIFAAACGKQTFLAAALIGTPPVPNPISPATPLPAQSLALAYLGTIDTSNPTKIDSSKVATVPGAKGDLSFHSALKNKDFDLAVTDRGDGSYTIDSQSNADFNYEPSQPYTLVLVGGDNKEAYGAKLLPAPVTTIKEFPSTKTLTVSAGPDFTVTRTDAPDASDGRLLPAFVAVMKVDPQNPSNLSLNNLLYSTLPKDGAALLKFALSDANYRKASFVIPGATFTKGGYYVVALIVIKYGLVSENTFLGSTAMSGTGDAGLLVVQ